MSPSQTPGHLILLRCSRAHRQGLISRRKNDWTAESTQLGHDRTTQSIVLRQFESVRDASCACGCLACEYRHSSFLGEADTGARVAVGAATSGGAVISAVSYTHLTLPTNREV